MMTCSRFKDTSPQNLHKKGEEHAPDSGGLFLFITDHTLPNYPSIVPTIRATLAI